MPKPIFAHWDGYEFAYRIRHDGPRPLRPVLDEIADVVEGAVLIVGGDSPEHSLKIDDPLVGALTYSESVVAALEEDPGAVVIAKSSADMDRARAANVPWLLLGIEGCRPLRGSIAVLQALFRLGVRSVGLTWNGANEVASGVGVSDPTGLTAFGAEVVSELNRLGVLIDVSHLAAAGLEDVLEASSEPVYASHSNAAALKDHRRNLSEEQIRQIAERGGVVGVNFHPTFLASPTLEAVVHQVEHLVSVAGLESVAIGGDFTYDPWREELAGSRGYEGVQMDTTTRYPVHRPGEMGLLAAALDGAGLSNDAIELIFNGNLRRFFSQVIH